jgi:hypothetical protein
MVTSYAVEGGNPQICVGGSNESITQAHHRFVSLLQLLSERPIGASVLDRQETARPDTQLAPFCFSKSRGKALSSWHVTC